MAPNKKGNFPNLFANDPPNDELGKLRKCVRNFAIPGKKIIFAKRKIEGYLQKNGSMRRPVRPSSNGRPPTKNLAINAQWKLRENATLAGGNVSRGRRSTEGQVEQNHDV